MTKTLMDDVFYNMERFCRERLWNDIDLQFTERLSIGDGNSDFSDGDRHMWIGTRCRNGFFGPNMRDVIGVCVAAGHELRHFEQCGFAKGHGTISKDVCISHMACRHNQVWYNVNGKKNHMCEADAERFGYTYSLFVLSDMFGQDRAARLLLDYCNEHIRHPSEYYLCEADCKKFPLGTLDDLSDAFDNALERCRQSCRAYSGKKDTPFGDEFFDAMRRGRTMKEDCFGKFVRVNRNRMPVGLPTLRDGMACLSLYLHPEYVDEYPVDLSGLSAEAVFGSPFQETPEQMRRYMAYVREHEVPVLNRGSPLEIPEPRRIAGGVALNERVIPVVSAGSAEHGHDGPDGPGE